MAVTGYTGTAAYIVFGSTTLNTYYRTASPSEEIDLVEKSAGADANKTYLTALKDGSADFELVMPAGTAGTALWGAVAPGTSGTLEWAPRGTTATYARHYVTAIVKNRGQPLTYNDLSTISVSFQFNSAVTDGTY